MDLSLTIPHVAATPKRPASAPALRKSFASTKRQDPSFWDKEVVHALCTRLPGGLSSVTKPCSVCKSVFYPCLCEPSSRDYGLRAPKIVRAAEQCRLSVSRYPPRQVGSLYCVHSKAERRDMNKNRLVVMGNDGMGIVRRSLVTAQVLDRKAADYLVCRDGTASAQALAFSWEELAELERCLEEHPDRTLVVRECVASKLQTLRYNTKAQASGDVVLVRVPLGWEVREVKEGGVASSAGLREGHFLCELEVLSDEWEDTWSEQRPPCSLLSPVDPLVVEEPDDGRAFPCQLTFERLPIGSCAVREAAAPGEKGPGRRLRRQRLKELIAAKEGATIVFERALQEFVSRDTVLCRHEHLWEKRPDEYTQQEDETLLRHWTFGAHLTLASLSFVFKKLVDMITEEMQRFERAKGLRMRLLLEKCRRCVELQAGDSGLEPSRADSEVRYVLGEVHAIFQAVPIYFLREIRGDISSSPMSPRGKTPSAPSSKRPSFCRKGSTNTELANALATREVHSAEPEVFELLLREVNKYLASIKPASASQRARLASPSSPKKSPMSPGKEEEKSMPGMRRPDPAMQRIQRAAAKKTNQNQQLSDEALDGKISHKEFERILITAGITWLTRTQQKQMFDSLDHDKTGKLNLGEILSAAGRIMELISRVSSYAEEQQEKEHRTISQAKMMQEFCRDCLRDDGAVAGAEAA